MEVLNKKFDKLYPDKEEESILAVNLESPAMKCLEKLKVGRECEASNL